MLTPCEVKLEEQLKREKEVFLFLPLIMCLARRSCFVSDALKKKKKTEVRKKREENEMCRETVNKSES